MRLIDGLLSIPLVFEWQQNLFNNYSAIKEEFKDYLNVSGKDILDIGCSTGICASKVIPMDANRYVGVDIERDYIKIASARYPKQVTFLHMDARKLEFEDQRFDLILFFSVLHHMDDDLVKGCFNQLKRVLNKDGTILVSEPLFSDSILSNVFLKLDRGKYIRNEAGYQELFKDFRVVKKGYFKMSLHRFCSFVLGQG